MAPNRTMTGDTAVVSEKEMAGPPSPTSPTNTDHSGETLRGDGDAIIDIADENAGSTTRSSSVSDRSSQSDHDNVQPRRSPSVFLAPNFFFVSHTDLSIHENPWWKSILKCQDYNSFLASLQMDLSLVPLRDMESTLLLVTILECDSNCPIKCFATGWLSSYKYLNVQQTDYSDFFIY